MRVTLLVRREVAAPPGCTVVLGNPLDAGSFQSVISPGGTFLHLVGVSHPSPAKAELFRSVDLASARASVEAAAASGIRHFIYVSVAQPAPVMQAYIAARREAEEAIRASGIPATILRPWYVTGPGHRWPLVLLPLYKVMALIPPTREGALRLGMVPIARMARTI